MKIAVAGGKGFIGTPLVSKLREGHSVESWDLPEFDIRNAAEVAKKISAFRPDLVVNLSAILGGIYSRNINEIFETNVFGNLNLLYHSAECGVGRYVFASSLTVHGGNEIGRHCVSDSPFRPKHAYSASKAAAEYGLMQYARHYGISATVLRPASVLGKDTYMNHAPSDFVQTLLRGETIELFGGGTHEREWVWIDDVVDGFVKAVDFCGRAPSGYFPFFLSANRISMKSLAQKCIDHIGGAAKDAASTVQAFSLTCDTEDTEKMLGWKAQYSIDDIIKKLVEIFGR